MKTNLATIRNMRGLSQQALADMISKDKATISRAESLSDGTTMKIYKACAIALDVTLEDLFCDLRTDVEMEIVKIFREASEPRKAFLKDLLLVAETHAAAMPQGKKPTDPL